MGTYIRAQIDEEGILTSFKIVRQKTFGNKKNYQTEWYQISKRKESEPNYTLFEYESYNNGEPISEIINRGSEKAYKALGQLLVSLDVQDLKEVVINGRQIPNGSVTYKESDGVIGDGARLADNHLRKSFDRLVSDEILNELKEHISKQLRMSALSITAYNRAEDDSTILNPELIRGYPKTTIKDVINSQPAYRDLLKKGHNLN